MSPFFVPSPLAEGSSLPQAEIDRLCAIYGDQAIQHAAGDLRWKLDRLAKLALYRCLIAQAIATADRSGISPIKALRRMDEAADGAIASARVDRLAHDAAVKARSDWLQPLVLAVAQVIETATRSEINSEALDCGPGAVEKRGLGAFQHLQAAGLNQAQIMALGGPEPEDDVRRKQKLRDQLAECDRVLGQCERYNSDPMLGPHHLAGLGLDDVIAQVGAATHPSKVHA
jgi:hypothetical protein